MLQTGGKSQESPTNRDVLEVQKERDIVTKLGGDWLRPEATRDMMLNSRQKNNCNNVASREVNDAKIENWKINKTRTKSDFMKNK